MHYVNIFLIQTANKKQNLLNEAPDDYGLLC